ncbi:Pyrimidine-specific ribonucleoside hydrolase RihA [Chlorella vulgaris]
MARKLLWLDVDVGVDDAQASTALQDSRRQSGHGMAGSDANQPLPLPLQGLMLALAHADTSIVGISAVHGNVDVRKVALNIARILTLCDRIDVPFHCGADEPLTAAAMDASFFHGLDGLGDVPATFPAYSDLKLAAAPGHAAVHLARAVEEHEGELTIVATGPLTNIALACKLCEDLPSKVGRLVVMGGAEAAGNVTPTAEYNFHCDPESAQLVLRKFPQTLLVTWDCTIKHALDWSWVDAWLSKPGAKATFMRDVMAKSMAYEQQREPGTPGLTDSVGWIACDPLAVALAVCDDALLESEPKHCVVETKGTLTRGMSVFQDPGGKAALKANVLLVKSICMARFAALLDAATD